MIRLGDLCEKITDGTHHSPVNLEAGPFKYITAKNIKPWGLDLRNVTYVDEATHREIFARCDVRKNDILYVKDGATTGVIAINTLEEEFSLLSSVGVLRAGPAIKPKYLLYALQDPKTKTAMMDNVAGVAITRLTLKKLNDSEVPVAPLAIQDRIVDKLEELLSELDAGVAELKAAQKKLTQYRQSLLKAAVEGALTADWRAERAKRGEPIETGAQLLERILRERRARWEARQLAKFAEQGKAPPKDWREKYPEPLRADESQLAELPDGWAWATIDQISQMGTGVTPLRSNAAFFDGGTFPWVTSGALNSETVTLATEHVTELALKECRLEIYPAGSLLVAMYGEGKTRGKCSELLIPATINQAIAAIVLEPEAQASKSYVKAFLLDSYERMRAQASGGVQPNLNLQIVKSIALPLPPNDEQTEITKLLAGQFDQISQQQIAVDLGLKQAAAQRKNILKAAFSGQLVQQDPNDEPATALLERIRADRTSSTTAIGARGRKTKAAA